MRAARVLGWIALVVVQDASAQSVAIVSATANSASVIRGGGVSFTIVTNAPVPAEGLPFQFSSTGQTVFIPNPAAQKLFLSVAGQTSYSVGLGTTSGFQDVNEVVTFTANGTSASASFSAQGTRVTSLTAEPSVSVLGCGGPTSAPIPPGTDFTVQYNGPISLGPIGGSPLVVEPLRVVAEPSGALQISPQTLAPFAARFHVTAQVLAAPTLVRLTVGDAGRSASVDVTVAPPTPLKIDVFLPNGAQTNAAIPVIGGTELTGVVTYRDGCLVQGMNAVLATNNAAVTLPPQATVGAPFVRPGTSTTFQNGVHAPFSIKTHPVATDTQVTISTPTGAVPTSNSQLVVLAPDVVALKLASPVLAGGESTALAIELNGPAPPGGMPVSLTSVPAVVQLPNRVVVQAGQKTVRVNVPGPALGQETAVRLSASTDGVTVQDASLTIKGAALAIKGVELAKLVLAVPALRGGEETSGTIHLRAPGRTGVKVALRSSSREVVVPAEVAVPPGADQAKFAIRTAKTSRPVSVTIEARGANTVSAALTVNPALPLAPPR